MGCWRCNCYLSDVVSQGLIVDEVNACSLDNLDLTAFGDSPDLDKTQNELLEKEI